jgi:hypothetical protein
MVSVRIAVITCLHWRAQGGLGGSDLLAPAEMAGTSSVVCVVEGALGDQVAYPV